MTAGFTSVFRGVLLGLVAVLGVTAATSGSAAEPWSVLVLIYTQTDATCTVSSPSGSSTTHTASATLQEGDLTEIEVAVDNFEQIVSEWSAGLGAVHIAKTIRVQRAIGTATDAGGQDCWLAPEDAGEELDKYLPSGDYDSVVAIWDKGSLPGPLGAAAFEPVEWQGKTITWSTVHAHEAFLDPGMQGSNFQDPGEAILHEWLHPVGSFYRGLGYSVPDADDGGDYPFPSANPDGIGGFKEFYRRLLQGRLVDSPGKYTGISRAVWAAGSLRANSGATPLPLQLVAPPDTLCQDDDALLEWTGPALPPLALYEITLTDDQGGQISVQTNQDEVALSDLSIQSGRTYRWKVRTSAAPAASEVDQLEFRATGPGPAPPKFTPDGGLLSSEGSPVFIYADRGTEIRYTVSGIDPTPGDPLVPPTGEVQVDPPAVLKARAFAPNCAPSSVKSSLYGFADVLTVSNTNDSNVGPPADGTLRKAISDANLAPGRQEIVFAIPGTGPHRIDIASPLPTITDGVLIDGWSQPGFSSVPLIEIDGAAAGSGLVVTGGNTSIRGLIINNSGAHGILLQLVGNNIIRGCYIGTNAAGTAARANLGSGIYISGVDSNWIGGTDPVDRNVISGNRLNGIELAGAGATGNYVLGNYVGTDRTGSVRISNGNGGVQLSGAPGNQIGGTVPGAGNLISGNGFSGLPNTGDGLGIAGPGADGNIVEGNRIGTDASGAADLGNSRDGVIISALVSSSGPAASDNRIGGTEIGARNVISGNDGDGISIIAVNGGATGNLVQGNFIGTDAFGSFDLGNSLSGVDISRASATGLTASGNVIGGTEEGARNVISGNNLDGVTVVGNGNAGNTIQGNYIGTDVQGIFDVGNTRSGVRLTTASAFADSASFNTVGGPSYAARNVISGNDQNGIAIVGKQTTAGDNRIVGNFIGIGAGGSSGPGNAVDGILITTTVFGGNTLINSIGGLTPGARNIIGRNGGAGIRLDGTGVDTTFVNGNLIGVDASGNPQPNGGDGIFVAGPNNSFGGNTIAWNSGAGVVVSAANQNWVHQNSIFQNGGLGIDLINGNGSLPAPVLTAATTTSGTIISGSLGAAPSTEYTLEFFASPTCDPSGFGEGMTVLGRTEITTNAAGNAAFLSSSPETVSLGHVVTATATEYLGDNTSEFSACVTVATGPPTDPDGDQDPVGGDNCPGVPNPGQEDTGGVNTALPNGRGDACECGDVTNNGRVDAADLALFRAHLTNPGLVWTGTILGKCSVFGSNPSGCDLADTAALRRALSGLAPGISGACALP